MRGPFKDIGERLLQAGIAPRHVRRYLNELNEHLEDMVRAETDAGLREPEARDYARKMMGDADMLTESMLAQGRFHSMAARAPWLVFLFSPTLMLFGFFVLIGIVLALAGWVGIPGFYLDTSGRLFRAPYWYVELALWLIRFANFVVPPLIASLIASIALRQRVDDPEWPILGIVLIAALGAGLTAEIDFPRSPAGRDWTIALVVSEDIREILMRGLATLTPIVPLLLARRET